MSGERNKPATSQKLSKSRRDGTIARAPEAIGLVGSIAALGMLIWLGVEIIRDLDGLFTSTIDSTALPFAQASTQTVAAWGAVLKRFFLTLIAVTIAVTIIATLVAQKGIAISVKAVIPDLQRISPVSGLRQIFSMRGLAKLVQGGLRLIIWFAAVGLIVAASFGLLLNMPACGVTCTSAVTQQILVQLAIAAVLIMGVAAAIDMRVQYALFQHDQRMSETEFRKEQKDQFGAPEIRKARRSRQRGSGGSEALGPAQATMCFYDEDACVALRYHPKLSPMPRVSAVSMLAARSLEIRAIIQANGHPELEHPEIVAALARAIPGEAVTEDVFEVLVHAIAALYAEHGLSA